MPRFELEMDEDTRVALQRLALAEDRSQAATIRHMVRQAAMAKGLWTPRQPKLVPASRKLSSAIP